MHCQGILFHMVDPLQTASFAFHDRQRVPLIGANLVVAKFGIPAKSVSLLGVGGCNLL